MRWLMEETVRGSIEGLARGSMVGSVNVGEKVDGGIG